jgi:hypothetical protein
MGRKARLFYVVDAAIGLAFALSAVTGLAFLLLGSGGYQGGRNPSFRVELLAVERGTWSDLHTWASIALIAGIALHVVLHWRWILRSTVRFVRPSAG